jgi:hypothetical protein
MNAPGSFGRSYTDANGHAEDPDAVNYGLNFQEQWERAFVLDPEFVFITGWNEWIAGRYEEWQQQHNAFPDQYNQEHSRDIEPMKGGHGDNYYYQMVANIRKFKGVAKPPKFTRNKKISIDGDFVDWETVAPKFKSHKGNTLKRNSGGWGDLVYKNTTGRNDIVASKVTSDKDNLYFYVETANPLSPSDDPAWMRLFIDTDRNGDTGWEGYDYVINRSNPGEKATIEKNTGGWNWEKVDSLNWKISVNKMEIAVPKTVLKLNGKVNIEFKWSDNMQAGGEIMDFLLHGDVAPLGRFNYYYAP